MRQISQMINQRAKAIFDFDPSEIRSKFRVESRKLLTRTFSNRPTTKTGRKLLYVVRLEAMQSNLPGTISSLRSWMVEEITEIETQLSTFFLSDGPNSLYRMVMERIDPTTPKTGIVYAPITPTASNATQTNRCAKIFDNIGLWCEKTCSNLLDTAIRTCVFSGEKNPFVCSEIAF